jgi:hypothetical protein
MTLLVPLQERHGRTNDPVPEGWTLLVADGCVTFRSGSSVKVLSIAEGMRQFAVANAIAVLKALSEVDE